MGNLKLIIKTDAISIYSPQNAGDSVSEFEQFLIYCGSIQHPQLQKAFASILSYINTMKNCGARENVFRPEYGLIVALPLLMRADRIDRSVGKLRLYCIRISDRILIIGKGLVTTSSRNNQDPNIIKIIDELKAIEHKIWRISRKMNVGYYDFNEMIKLIENLTI